MVIGLLDVLLTGPVVLHLVQTGETSLWHLTSLTGLVTGTAIVRVLLVTPVNLALHSSVLVMNSILISAGLPADAGLLRMDLVVQVLSLRIVVDAAVRGPQVVAVS